MESTAEERSMMDLFEDPDLNETSIVEEVLRKSNEVDPKILDRYIHNRAIDEPAYTTLIFMYLVLIIVGALGNTLVVSMGEVNGLWRCIPNTNVSRSKLRAMSNEKEED